MEIYCSRDNYDILKYIGKDIWLKCCRVYNGQEVTNTYNYIRLLNIDRGIIEYNKVPSAIIDSNIKISDRTLGCILNDVYHSYPEDIKILRPIDAISTDELLEMLE